jgi:hypothetical protein
MQLQIKLSRVVLGIAVAAVFALQAVAAVTAHRMPLIVGVICALLGVILGLAMALSTKWASDVRTREIVRRLTLWLGLVLFILSVLKFMGVLNLPWEHRL